MAETPPASSSPSQTPTDPTTSKAMAEAEVAKAQADARKAGADADTAAVGARAAALKAVLGDLPPPPNPSTVTTGDKGGLAEHNKLARQALEEVAAKIVNEAAPVLAGQNVYVTADDAGPNRSATQSFAFQKKIVAKALSGALTLSRKLDPDTRPDGEVADALPLAAIGLVLTGINAVLSYARVDFTLGGREFQPGDRSLITAVAQAVLKLGKKVRVDGPSAPIPETIQNELIDELTELSIAANDARERSAHHEAAIKKLSPSPALPSQDANAPPPPDPDPNHERPIHERALQALNAAIKLCEDLETSLLAVTAGISGIQRIATERALSAYLDEADGRILVVKLEGIFGSSLDKKSAWATISGELPYKLSSVAQANWRCFDPKNASLLGSGLISEYIPFKNIESV